MTATPEPVERARSGVRAWVRAAGSGLRRAGPYGILAFLSASAVAPVAGAALGAPAEFAVALDQLGGMGGSYLADVLAGAARRKPDATGTDWRDAVGAEILARLREGDDGLRDELTELLRAVGAVDTALHAADEQTRLQIAAAFDELQVLAVDTRRVLDDIRRGLSEQVEEQRRDTGRVLSALAATTALIRSLRAPAETGRPVPAGVADVAPYPGLASFDVGDAPFFHGREELVRHLLERLDDHLLGGPPLVVVGPSGAGKSSLLRAGLLPAVAADGLGDGSGTWPWHIITPGATPLATLRSALGLRGADHGVGPAVGSAGADDRVADGPAARDEGSAEPGAFGPGAGVGGPGSQGRRVVLVDQFEELFTQCADVAERDAFVAALADLPGVLLIIAVRADFYPQCIGLPSMAGLLGRGQVVVGPLSEAELRRAIVEPARDAGLTVEPGLVEVLLRDYEPGALPLLAHALRATWERREGDTLTVAGYARTGGIRRAVAETAERVYASLDPDRRAALPSALLGLVTVVDGLAVRRRAAVAEVDLAVLRPLVAQRLVTVDADTVEISHEALLDGWPRLAGWEADARVELLLREGLSRAAAEWAAAGEDPDALYRGARLAAAREFAAGRTDLPGPQRRFLAASSAADAARQRAERRTTRRLRRLVAGLAVALLLAAAGGVVALVQGRQARINGQAALSRQNAAESRLTHFADPAASIDGALAGWAAAPTAEARAALLYAQHVTPVYRLGSRTGAVRVAVSADGARVAAAYPDGEIELWDAVAMQPVRPSLRHPAGTPISVRFSPDGRFLAAGSADARGVAVWDVASRTLRHRLPAFGAVAWLPDSSAVLAMRADVDRPEIGEWAPDGGRRTGSIPVPMLLGAGLAVNADGSLVAGTGTSGGALVRRSGGAVLARLPDAWVVGFDAGGTLFSLASPRGSLVEARRAADGWRPVTLPDPTAANQPALGESIAVTPDGTVLKASGDAGEILRLTVGGPRPELGSLHGLPEDLALSADGRLLAVVGQHDAPTLLRLNAAAMPHPQVVSSLAVDPAGTRLATGSADPVIRVWDPHRGTLRSTIPVAADDGPLGLAFGPDGSLAASLSEGGRVLLFGPGERLRHTYTIGAALYPAGVMFSPDGSMLAVVTNSRALHGSAADEPPAEVFQRDDPDVIVWDTRSFEQRAVLKLPGSVPLSAVFTPDGRHLLVGAHPFDGPAAVWRFRVPDLTVVDSREVPGEAITEMAVSPDASAVAVAAGPAVRLLRVDGLAPLRDLPPQPSAVTRVAWSPDGRTLATATDTSDGQLLLWDAGTGDRIADARGDTNQWGPVRFSPDGRMLFAGLNDWTVAAWRLDPEEAVDRLCAVVRRTCRTG